MNNTFYSIVLLACFLASSCSPTSSTPAPGPDKQAVGTWYGAALGATSGAVYGAQLSVGAGPGAFAGAGLGAVYGMFSGLGQDLLEDDELRRQYDLRKQHERLWVQEVLAEHYNRRLELHPSRDIFPADWFFDADGTTLKPEGKILAKELAVLSKERMPWSRFVIASYVTSTDSNSTFATHVNEHRGEQLADAFIAAGIDPRRLLIQPITLDAPLLIDPYDSPNRYRQAIELIPIDY